MSDLLQVLVLMAVPAAILGTMGHFNRKADRRFAELDAGSSANRQGRGEHMNPA